MNVYFIRTIAGPRLLKIGISNNVSKRLESLKTGCAYPLELVGTITCRSPMHARNIERQLHRMHRWARMEGEWFEYSPQVRAGLRNILAGDISLIYENALAGWRSKPQREEAKAEFDDELSREFASRMAL